MEYDSLGKLKGLKKILAHCNGPLQSCKERALFRLTCKVKFFFYSTKYLSCEFGLVIGNRRAGSKLEGTYREAGNKFSNKNGKNIYGLVYVL